jgi:DNA segregation ATPase FtsK/SpoIIIE-like protein
MYCSKCGKHNDDDAKVCKYCGYTLVSSLTTTPTTAMDSVEGETIPLNAGTGKGSILSGRYEILNELGRGGMGVVYKAIDKTTHKYVAIKVLHPHIAIDQEYVQRFHHEAKAALKLSSPYIVPTLSIEEDHGLHYIVMGYVEGKTGEETLSKLIQKRGILNEQDAKRIIQQVCEGLKVAHEQGVVHRDIKSQNIIIDKDGNALITDFGIAKLAGATKLTKTGQVLGTPEYASPEQIQGKKEIDQRSDIYSLGVVMYEMLTGKVPFTADTPIAVGIKHLNEAPESPRKINSDIDEQIENIILKCMAKEPQNRFNNIDELLSAIEGKITVSKQKFNNVVKPTKVNYTIAIVAVILLLGSIIGYAIYNNFMQQAEQAKQQAIQKQREAEQLIEQQKEEATKKAQEEQERIREERAKLEAEKRAAAEAAQKAQAAAEAAQKAQQEAQQKVLEEEQQRQQAEQAARQAEQQRQQEEQQRRQEEQQRQQERQQAEQERQNRIAQCKNNCNVARYNPSLSMCELNVCCSMPQNRIYAPNGASICGPGCTIPYNMVFTVVYTVCQQYLDQCLSNCENQ